MVQWLVYEEKVPVNPRDRHERTPLEVRAPWPFGIGGSLPWPLGIKGGVVLVVEAQGRLGAGPGA